ncbi:TasA family protein [Actinoplanes sp. NPDC051851]|uniref:TasA family protein n=1 Tax=Actinoplanes sp. NPDC051851 TaxID=3154753 RepID=UPI0034488F83
MTKVARSAGMTARLGRGVATVAGLGVCSALVWSSSHATFTASTVNNGNTLGAGTVAISDNDAATAMFNASNLAPGDTATVCMGVTYTGTLTPTAIKMYFPTAQAQESLAGAAYTTWADSTAAEMDDYTTLQVEVNSADLSSDPGNSCAPASVGTFSDVTAAASIRSLISGNNAYATTTLSAPAIGKDKWRVFRFTYALPSGVTDSVQGDGIKFGVTWEAQR